MSGFPDAYTAEAHAAAYRPLPEPSRATLADLATLDALIARLDAYVAALPSAETLAEFQRRLIGCGRDSRTWCMQAACNAAAECVGQAGVAMRRGDAQGAMWDLSDAAEMLREAHRDVAGGAS